MLISAFSIGILSGPYTVSVSSYVCLECLVSLIRSITSGSYNHSVSSFIDFSKSCEKGIDGDIPFRTEYSKVSCCLHIVQLCFFIYSFLLQEEDSVIMAELDSDL